MTKTTRFRRHLIAIALGQALLAPLPAAAVGLGELTVESNLFQPLEASIEVHGVDSYEANNLRVTIADQAAFLRAQLDRHPILNSVRVSVVQDGDGAVRIRLTSDRAMREPLLGLLIETEWPGGRLLREYTLLLDPPPAPLTLATRPAASANTSTARAPVAETPVPASPGVAPSVPSGGSVALNEPVASETSRPSRPTSYGPVRRNEMLGTIAAELRPDSGVSLNQMMLALVEANPEAFILGNVNGLKAGSTLSVPTPESIQAYSRAEANSRIARHHGAWRNRQTLAEYDAAPPAPAPAAGKATQTADAAPPAGQASALRLEPTLPPQPETQVMVAGVSEKARQLEAELVETRADLAQREEQLDELQTRMAVYGAELERLRQQVENYQMEQAAAASAAMARVNEVAQAVEQPAEPGSNFPWLVGGLLGGMGLTGLGWFLLGRRRDYGERSLTTGDVVGDENFTDMVAKLGASTAVRDARANMAGQGLDLQLPDTDEIEKVRVHSEDEILSEVDVFIAYGLLDRAREVLEEAIAENPDNRVYQERLRLLDQAPADPEAVAPDNHGIMVESEMDEDAQRIWSRFAEMGLKLPPESDVIDLGAAEVSKTQAWRPEAEAPEGSTVQIDRLTAGSDQELDFALPAETGTRPVGPAETSPTEAFEVDESDPRTRQQSEVMNYEPTIEVPLDLDADEIEALMRDADAQNPSSAEADPSGDAEKELLDEDGLTHEWDWRNIESDDETLTPTRAMTAASPSFGDTDEHPQVPDEPSALAEPDVDENRMRRSNTVEERSAADFIVDWQMDQDDDDSGTFDLPGDEDLEPLEHDETEQWRVPTELRDALDDPKSPRKKDKS